MTAIKPNQLSRPTQAVILAGGRGIRLRPFTDTKPKAMIQFHGKVFLEYLIEMLRDQGFERVLLLLGYLPEVIQDYFGDGRKLGIEIDYSVSSEDDETGRRIKLAEPRLDPCFLLMYCDNYWPMRMDDMWERFAAANVLSMITIYSNVDGYSKDNVYVDQDGYVVVYDKSRAAPGLQGVEIGYMLMNRSGLDLLPKNNSSFELTVYPRLIKQRQLLTYMTDHRYYSVGSHDRLPLTNTFLARRPTIILTRDSVLVRKPAGEHKVCAWDGFQWLPESLEALCLLREAGYRVIIVSGEPDAASGLGIEDDLASCIKAEAVEAGGRIDGIYYRGNGRDSQYECRGNGTGVLFHIQRDFDLDLTRTCFVGCHEGDSRTASLAGCPVTLMSQGTSLLGVVRELFR